MLYADDAGVVSQSPEQLGKMMRVIVVVCAAFGLAVSEANTKIMCLRTKGMHDDEEEECLLCMLTDDSIIVSSTWKLTPVSMRYSQGDGVNISLFKLVYCTHV